MTVLGKKLLKGNCFNPIQCKEVFEFVFYMQSQQHNQYKSLCHPYQGVQKKSEVFKEDFPSYKGYLSKILLEPILSSFLDYLPFCFPLQIWTSTKSFQDHALLPNLCLPPTLEVCKVAPRSCLALIALPFPSSHSRLHKSSLDECLQIR